MSEEFTAPKKPDGEMPDLPPSLDGMTDSKLMDWYQVFNHWFAWQDYMLALKQMSEDTAEVELANAQADAMVGAHERFPKAHASLLKATAEASPEVKAARAKLLLTKSERRLIERQKTRAERAYQHCSRELSRRTQPKRPDKPAMFGHMG